MLDVDYRFRPRQVHALLLLLVLLPCVPAAVLFRFMMESLATERAALTERAAAFYGAQLNAVAGALQNPYLQEIRVLSAESSANELVLLAESRGIGALWPRDLAARGSEGFRKSSTELEVKAGEFVAKAREGEWMELEAGSPWMACLIRPVARPAGVVLMRLRATMVEALEGFANAGFGEEARIRLLTPQSEGS